MKVKSVHQAIDGIENVLSQIAERFYPSESWDFEGETMDADTLMFYVEEGLKLHPPMRFRTIGTPPEG